MRVSRLITLLAAVTTVLTFHPVPASCEDAAASPLTQAGFTVPSDFDGSPDKYKNVVQGLKLESAFDEGSVPQGSIIKSIKGNLHTALYSGLDGGRFIVFANKGNADQSVTITFTENVTLFRMSRFTGLPRRKGSQDVWEMKFYPSELRLYQWLPGKDEPKNARPRVALNPSSQYANVITKDGKQIYNEGENMWLIAVKTKELLDRDGRIDTYITRRSQRQEMFLRQEMDIAKMAKADAVVAMHSDATGTSDPGGGTWTFYKDAEGKRLATDVQMSLFEAIKKAYPEVQLRGIREHWYKLYVLYNAGCPSSLTEVLFHTNPKERELLKDPPFQDIVARAFANGILKFFGYDVLKDR